MKNMELPHASSPSSPWPKAHKRRQVATAPTSGVPLFVDAEADLVAKHGKGRDSWFAAGHLRSGDKTLFYLMHYYRVDVPDMDPFAQAIVSVIDPESKENINRVTQYPLAETTFSTQRFDVHTPTGGMCGTPEEMYLSASHPEIAIDLKLQHQGPILANGGTGLMPYWGSANFHFAMPKMASSGWIDIKGKRYEVTGSSWFDRYCEMNSGGISKTNKWVWMGISLDNGDRISLWDMMDVGNTRTFATVLHPNGDQENASVEPLIKGASEFWSSEQTGGRYPTRLRISIPSLSAQLEVAAVISDQEVVPSMKGTEGYEGGTTVTGTIRGKRVNGQGVVGIFGHWG